ncbi:hypothetical protein KY332_03140 [Candidatus Woesearchaeota archaeon]|nr:hypothetical protein [Candidatus Woesearchaeota archaeon]
MNKTTKIENFCRLGFPFRKTKKAQIAGQVFIFILAAVLAILIITYGYRAIKSFTDRTSQIALVSFKNTLESELRTTASDPRSVNKLDLVIPGNFEKFCIIDLAKPPSNEICSPGPNYNPFICDAWQNPSYPDPENAFFIPMTPMKLPTIEIDPPGYLCPIPSKNKISLRLEGKGDRAKVSEWKE